MQQSRVFCIIAFVLIIATISSNITFRSDNDNDTNTRDSVISSISFPVSFDHDLSLSSLIQPIDAQEQEESNVQQLEEVGATPIEDPQPPAEEEPEQQQDPQPPAEEEPEQQQDPQPPAEEEPQETSEAQIDNNEENNNNTSFNGFGYPTNASTLEDRLSVHCNPLEVEVKPGEDASINCTIENKGSEPIEIVAGCLGLEDTGIRCYINGEYPMIGTLSEMSDTDFSIVLVSSSSPPVPAGSYPFIISVDECNNSDLC
jgi:type IV secretory pathway VirB10-like protein